MFCMTLGNHINRLFWVLDVIGTHGPITLKEINKRWLRRSDSLGLEIDRYTFMRDKQAIEDIFDIEIERYGQNKYVLKDPQHSVSRSLQNHMLANIHESNFMNGFRRLGSLISIPSVNKGSEYLNLIGEAMTEGYVLSATYHKYDAEPYDMEVQPYCLKLFNRRWYLFAKKLGEDCIKGFSLDRVMRMDLTDKRYERDAAFDPDAFFGDYFGVFVGGVKAEDVLIRTTRVSMKFLEDLPLHHSQRRIAKDTAFSLLQDKQVACHEREGYDFYFRFHIAPTPDFENELLRMCENCEVLHPIWFRQKLHQRLQKALTIMSSPPK